MLSCPLWGPMAFGERGHGAWPTAGTCPAEIRQAGTAEPGAGPEGRGLSGQRSCRRAAGGDGQPQPAGRCCGPQPLRPDPHRTGGLAAGDSGLAAGGRPGPVGCSLVLPPVDCERFPGTVASARPPETGRGHSHRRARRSAASRPHSARPSEEGQRLPYQTQPRGHRSSHLPEKTATPPGLSDLP